jgi:hypothetical protein
MPANNLRALQWTGESYDSGPGNTRTINWPPAGPTPLVQVAAPSISSISFTVPYLNASQWFAPTTSGEVLIRNRNEYWLTLQCTVTTSNGATNTVSIPVAPLGLVFLPPTVTAIVSIQGGNLFDGSQSVPVSGQYLYLDYVVIQ